MNPSEFSAAVPWQEYDCPIQKTDTDLEGDLMVYVGQKFHCHWCGGDHTVGVDVDVASYNANGGLVDTPTSEAEMQRFRLDWKADLK